MALSNVEQLLLNTGVRSEIKRLVERGYSRDVARRQFENNVRTGQVLLRESSPTNLLAQRLFARAREQYLPELLMIFDEQWPAGGWPDP